jgi:hypothetical protein
VCIPSGMGFTFGMVLSIDRVAGGIRHYFLLLPTCS